MAVKLRLIRMGAKKAGLESERRKCQKAFGRQFRLFFHDPFLGLCPAYDGVCCLYRLLWSGVFVWRFGDPGNGVFGCGHGFSGPENKVERGKGIFQPGFCRSASFLCGLGISESQWGGKRHFGCILF